MWVPSAWAFSDVVIMVLPLNLMRAVSVVFVVAVDFFVEEEADVFLRLARARAFMSTSEETESWRRPRLQPGVAQQSVVSYGLAHDECALVDLQWSVILDRVLRSVVHLYTCLA